MPQTHSRSLQQIKQETELTRAGLTDTVEQLRNSITETAGDVRRRIKPDVIRAELSDYFTNRREQLLSDITEAAKKNPMQTIAIGAAVAYPLLRMARSIPIPILMVGAGLYLAGSRGKLLSQRARRIASDQLDRATGAMSAGIDGLTDQSMDATAAGVSKTRGIQDKAKSAVASVSSSASEFKQSGARLADAATSAAQGFAENATSAARHALAATTDAGLDTARSIKQKAGDLAQTTGSTVRQSVEQNPFAVAGAGLVLGALLASLLPRSQVENQLIGGTSTQVKKRAQAVASEGLEAAKGAVREAYDEAAQQAEGLADDAGSSGEHVRHVAESSVTTAFEPGQDQDQPQNENQRRFTE